MPACRRVPLTRSSVSPVIQTSPFVSCIYLVFSQQHHSIATPNCVLFEHACIFDCITSFTLGSAVSLQFLFYLLFFNIGINDLIDIARSSQTNALWALIQTTVHCTSRVRLYHQTQGEEQVLLSSLLQAYHTHTQGLYSQALLCDDGSRLRGRCPSHFYSRIATLPTITSTQGLVFLGLAGKEP